MQEDKVGEQYYVNEYLLDRAYGGPEEGGWWFPIGEFITCHGTFVRKNVAEIRAGEIEREVVHPKNVGRPEVASVISVGRYGVLIEDRPGADFPVARPRYA